jgi:hypothetical protein
MGLAPDDVMLSSPAMRRRAPQLVALAALITLAAPAGAGPAAVDATLDDVRAIATPCPEAAAHCVGLVVHVAAAVDGGLVQGPDWIAGQVATANRLFAPLGLGFTVIDVRGLDVAEGVIVTRAERSALGKRRVKPGAVHVFVVAKLGDIDDTGHEINGVHWRRGGKHWVIVSARAWDLTLGHELGHFVGLPHSDVAGSIMNTTPRKEPPAAERAFQPDELERMGRNLRRMLRDRSLRDRVPPPPRPPRARKPVRGR